MNDLAPPDPAPPRAKALTPILVFGSGRSGSTALMGLLGGSRRIAFDKRYPYEATYLSYLALMASVAGGPHPRGKDISGWNRTALVTGSSSVIGPMTFGTDGYISRDRFGRDALAALWATFSKTAMRKAVKQGWDRPTHYAEKGGFFLIDFLEGKIETQQIYLMRDPRDVMMSSKSFNRKRGTLRFDWRAEDSDASYAERFVHRVRKRLEAGLAVTAGDPRKLAIRYEDIVLDPEATARRLSEFLGFEISAADALPANEEHKTTSDPAASVGRWRRDMDKEVQAIFDEHLGDVLDRAGYERAQPD